MPEFTNNDLVTWRRNLENSQHTATTQEYQNSNKVSIQIKKYQYDNRKKLIQWNFDKKSQYLLETSPNTNHDKVIYIKGWTMEQWSNLTISEQNKPKPVWKAINSLKSVAQDKKFKLVIIKTGSSYINGDILVISIDDINTIVEQKIKMQTANNYFNRLAFMNIINKLKTSNLSSNKKTILNHSEDLLKYYISTAYNVTNINGTHAQLITDLFLKALSQNPDLFDSSTISKALDAKMQAVIEEFKNKLEEVGSVKTAKYSPPVEDSNPYKDNPKKKAEKWSEKDWQEYLLKNIWILNPSTRYKAMEIEYEIGIKDGVQKSKRLDIITVDKDNIPIIFELKTPAPALLTYDKSHDGYYWTSDMQKAISQTDRYYHTLIENKKNIEDGKISKQQKKFKRVFTKDVMKIWTDI